MTAAAAEPDHNQLNRTRRLLILLGLSGFAISQPILSIAGENPTLFVFNDVGRGRIILGAIALTVLPPLLLWGVVAVAERVSALLSHRLFLLFSGALLALAGVQWSRELSLGAASWVVGILVGMAGVAALVRAAIVREWASFTAILPAVALLSFLFLSPTSDLLGSPSDVERNEIAGVEPSLVVIVFDELPTATLMDADGALNADDFPNFAEFAEDSTWHRGFTTTSARTQTALPAMLTGSLPTSRQPLWTNYPDNLFRMLAPTHGLTIHESFTQLCGTSACTEAGPAESGSTTARPRAAADQLLDLWTDRITGTPAAASLDDFEELVGEPASDDGDNAVPLFADDNQVRRQPTRLTEFLDAIGPSDDPHAYFLHLILPHIPFRWYPDGTQYQSEPNPFVTGALGRSEPWLIAVDEQRHELQARYTDRLLGSIIERLETEGVYDESIVVVVADHGMSFAIDERRRGLEGAALPGTAFVPLMVKTPGQTEGRIDDQNLQSHDLVPLIADALGVEVPWRIDGAAPGSAALEARGTTKVAYPSGDGIADGTLGDPVDYLMQDHLPQTAAHAIRARTTDDAQLGPLLDELSSRSLLGTEISQSAPLSSSGTVQVMALDDVEAEANDLVQAFIQGTFDGPATSGEIMFAVDGVFVTGSHLFEADGVTHFLAMLPSDVAGSGFSLRAVIIGADGTATEPTISG